MGIGVSLGLSMNFEAVTARYVDMWLERLLWGGQTGCPGKDKGSQVKENQGCGKEKFYYFYHYKIRYNFL